MPSPESSRRNLAKAKASPSYRRPRLFRSPKESQLIRSLVWQWLQSRPAFEGRRVYLPCPRRKNRPHRFKAGRCACGYERFTIDADGYVIDSRNRPSARRLAKKLGVSHTWVNTLIRRFRTDPERQERREQTWGSATLDQLRVEQARRREDAGFARYRARQIDTPAQRSNNVVRDGAGQVIYDPAELERQVKEFLKKQRDWKRDYGHVSGE